MNKLAAIAIMATLSLTLGACRDSEQGRFVMLKQGVYKGHPDDQLSAAALHAVRNRTVHQLGLSDGTGAVGLMSGDVRPPQYK